MKSSRTRVCSLITAAILLCASRAHAAAGITVQVNGQPVIMDRAPVVREGRVLVPLRGVFESMGATIDYDASTRHVHALRASRVADLTVGSRQATVDGKAVTLDVPAQIIGGRTLVPLRFLSEALGTSLVWNAASRTIAIGSPAGPAPPSTSYVPPAPPPPPPAMLPVIHSISHAYETGTTAGDVVRVTMTGSPRGSATFDLNGLVTGVGMQETAPGLYEGSVPLAPRQAARPPVAGAPIEILGHLSLGGRTDTLRDPVPLTLVAAPVTEQTPVVTILSPRRDEKVASTFTVTGTTTPNARVTITVDIRNPNLLGLGVHNARTVTATGVADAAGAFAIPVHLGNLGRRSTSVSLRATATDPLGNVSKPSHQYNIATGE